MSNTLSIIEWEVGAQYLADGAPSMITEPQTVQVTLGDIDAEDFAELEDDADTPHIVNLLQGAQLRLTKYSTLKLARECGISKVLISETPHSLIQPTFNYWLSTAEGDDGPQFTVDSDNVITGIVEGKTAFPLTAPMFADAIVSASKQDNVSFTAMTDFRHRRTEFVVLFDDIKNVSGVTGTWLGGIHVETSYTGTTTPVLSPMVYSVENGVSIILPYGHSKYSVRKHGKTLDGVMTWVDLKVEEYVKALPKWLDEFVDANDVVIEDMLEVFVKDVLDASDLPLGLKRVLVDNVESFDGDEMTAYDLAVLIAEMSKYPDEKPERRNKIMNAAGHVLTALGSRCQACMHLSDDLMHEH